jgi:L-asparaginase
MPETARYLGEKIKNKTIVLVGAITPYNEDFSDAMFNLGTALANVQLLNKGTYISMNGEVFNWNNVKKNKKLDIFETLV